MALTAMTFMWNRIAVAAHKGLAAGKRQRLLRGQAHHRALLHRSRAAADHLAQPSDQGGGGDPDGLAGRGVLTDDATNTLSARELLALQAFELAARTGSFKAAAEALHITASAVSHRIAGLEKTLGERLFERGPRGVVLAPAGRQLSAATGRAFGDLSRALARHSAGSRRLRLSAVPIFASYWLLPRLGQFLSAHPEIELQVEASPRMTDMEAGLAGGGAAHTAKATGRMSWPRRSWILRPCPSLRRRWRDDSSSARPPTSRARR